MEATHLHPTNRFTIASKDELVSAFRLRDQKKLILPENIRFPKKIESYFSWRESSGVYTYLVFKLPTWDLPRGVAFKKNRMAGEAIGGLCNWCHNYGSSEEIALMSVSINSKESCSYLLCHDLSCAEKIEQMTALAGKNPDRYMIELYYRMEKLFENLSEKAFEG